MFGKARKEKEQQAEQLERMRLQNLSEKELLIEMVIELKRISNKCDDIGRKIVIWSN